MILLLAGTVEGREIAVTLSRAGYRVTACVATEYGEYLLKGVFPGEVISGRLNTNDLAGLITSRNIRVLVDATHPFAEEATANARLACSTTGIQYIRFQRPPAALPENTLIHPVQDYPEAAERAIKLSSRAVFLATGAKTLHIFTSAARKEGKRIVARILPDRESLGRCLELGIAPGDIIAMQGPFSVELNKQLLVHFNADVLVTKESGAAGGVDAKIRAALELSLPVVVVQRPPAPEGAVGSVKELMNLLESRKQAMERKSGE